MQSKRFYRPCAFARDRGAPRPHVVFLGKTGFAVLKAICANPVLAGLPVIILGSSVAVADPAQARELRADQYLIKSADFGDFIAAAKTALRLAA